MEQIMFGVLDTHKKHVDISTTLQGAKMYASKNGHIIVTKRIGNHTRKVAKKLNNKWEEL